MSEYLPFIVFGLITGSIYGISAMGLVLTYKTSGVFNFAHGAVCAAAAYAFYDLRENAGLPWPVAGFLAVVVFGTILGLFLERLALALANVSTAYKVVATVGLLVAVQSAITLRYGPQAEFFRPFLSQDTAFTVEGVKVTWDNVAGFLLGVGSAIGLYIFFRRSRLGTAMRGVVDNASLLDMTGEPPARVRRYAWVIGSIFAAASGVMFAAVQQQLDVGILSLLVVQAFGAAAFGLFRSLPLAFVGGIVVGLLQKIVGKQVGDYDWLQGLDTNMPFVVLFLILLFAPKDALVEVGRRVKDRAVPASPFSPRVRGAGFAVLTVAVLLVPQLVGTKITFWNAAVTQAILFLSLGLLVRTSGQISLCQVGFAAVGAASFGHLLGNGVPWFGALLISGLIVVPIGALLAIPAMRLPTLYLALITLGFNILLAQYFFGKEYMFGTGQLNTSRPGFWDMNNDEHYYYLLVAIAMVCALLVVLVEGSRLGRLLLGIADSPIGLTTLGLNVNITRVIVFCFSAFLAGISGGLYASLFGRVSQDSFNYVNSLIVLAILAISGRRTVTAAIVAAVLYQALPGYTGDIAGWFGSEDAAKVQLCLNLAFGAFAVLVAALSQGQLSKALATATARARDRKVGPQGPRLAEVRRARNAARPAALAAGGVLASVGSNPQEARQ